MTSYFKGPKNLLGEKSITGSKGKCRIYFYHGSFNYVLYVIGLVGNILSIHQMTHTDYPQKVVFTPNDVEISDISNGRVIAKYFVDHSSKVYNFSQFMPFLNPFDFLTHDNESIMIWHERFGHLN